MQALTLCSILVVAGAIPVLPVLLSRARRSPDPVRRRRAQVCAFVLLWLCFSLTAGGLLAFLVPVLGPFGVVVFLAAGGWLSHHVAFDERDVP